MGSNAQRRATYRHGDLRHALVAAGIEMASAGGPDAVVLREATRRAGVVPNAAYRHFADRAALVRAVSQAAMGRLAAAMEAELAALPPGEDPASAARARLRAVGAGYLRFAQSEPGLFQTAFSVPADLSTAGAADAAGPGGRTPFQLLASALDDMASAGVLPPERRPGAEFLAWSTVHGLAMLTLGGPLRGLDAAQREVTSRQLLAMVERGL